MEHQIKDELTNTRSADPLYQIRCKCGRVADWKCFRSEYADWKFCTKCMTEFIRIETSRDILEEVGLTISTAVDIINRTAHKFELALEKKDVDRAKKISKEINQILYSLQNLFSKMGYIVSVEKL